MIKAHLPDISPWKYEATFVMLIGFANPLIHVLEVASELHWRTIDFLLDRMHGIGANANPVNSKRLAQTHSKTNIHCCRDMGISWITLNTKERKRSRKQLSGKRVS